MNQKLCIAVALVVGFVVTQIKHRQFQLMLASFELQQFQLNVFASNFDEIFHICIVFFKDLILVILNGNISLIPVFQLN